MNGKSVQTLYSKIIVVNEQLIDIELNKFKDRVIRNCWMVQDWHSPYFNPFTSKIICEKPNLLKAVNQHLNSMAYTL